MNKLRIILMMLFNVIIYTSGFSEVFLIGDFNNWELPNQNSDNSALPLMYDGSTGRYEACLDLVSGNHSFALFVTGENEGIYGVDDKISPSSFKLVAIPRKSVDGCIEEANSMWLNCKKGASIADVSPIRIRDWKGGQIKFSAGHPTQLLISSEDADLYADNDYNWNLVYRVDGGDWTLLRETVDPDALFTINSVIKGQTLEFFYTDQDTLTAALDHIWGKEDESEIFQEIQTPDDTYVAAIGIVNGGAPIMVKLSESRSIELQFSIPRQFLTINSYSFEFPSEIMAIIDEDGETGLEHEIYIRFS